MHDFTYARTPVKLPKRRDKKVIFMGLIAFILVTLPLYSIFFNSKKHNTVKTAQNGLGSPIGLPQFNRKKTPQEILKEIESVYTNSHGSYSVYVVNLNNNQGFGINEKVIYTGASINKLAILAALYNLAGKNEIDLEKIIVPQKEDIQDYGSGSIRYDPPGTPYSIKTLARLMMEKSDNTASYILANLVIGMDKIQRFTDSLEMAQTNMVDNKTSVYDISLLMTKIYKGEVTTIPLMAEMLSFMDQSDSDDRIPKGIPEGIKYYHKTGDEIGKLHDAAIIDLPGKPYFLGVFTSDITAEEETKTNIAEISRIVYNSMKD